MMLEYSTNAQLAATVFKEYRNSIDIYTEDCEKDKEFYVKLLKRLLEDTGIFVNDIYPLGCRRTVVQRCKEDKDTRRKRLYIVDGDVYLQYREKENIPNLFVLDAYCIENFMVCEDSVCNVAYMFCAKASYETVKSSLKISEILTQISEPLMNLFFYYSIQMECDGQFQLRNVDAYLDKATCQLDEKKVNKRIDEIETGLIQKGISRKRIDKLLAERKAKFPYGVSSLLMIVSGKDFLIPFIRRHASKQLGVNAHESNDVWKFNLADKCDINRLHLLKEAIVAAV